jgi:hypothetical protein
MTATLSAILSSLLKSAVLLLILNEVRGLVLAAPVLYGLYRAGGSLMAIWIALCSLAGIAITILAPLFAAKRLKSALLTIAS